MKNLFLLASLFTVFTYSWIAFSQRGGAQSLPQDYQNLRAENKQDLLWENIENTKWTKLPSLSGKGWASLLDNLKSVGSLATTFNQVSDELPLGRKKLLHPYGVVAKISFVVNESSSYTGIFQSGAIGIARFSLAGDPESIGFTPGVAFKFLIDGRPAQNMFVMHSLNGQGNDSNWFKYPFTNKLPEAKGFFIRAVSAFFSLTHSTPNFLSLDHLAKFDNRGNRYKSKAPEQVVLIANAQVREFISSHSKKDFREDLNTLKGGTELYQVFVSTKGQGQKLIRLGSIYLETAPIASQYADKKLFFQHHH